jgi:hypothetical protein
MIFYKAVKEDMNSYASVKYGVKYIVGEWVKPRLEGSKLFIFDTKENALTFIQKEKADPKKVHLYTCEVKNPMKAEYMDIPGFDYPFFWNYRFFKSDGYAKPPEGTYYGDEVKLIKKVEWYN